ncbi:hypothetical protein PACTADRAFT_139443 [Pachysolen tannophilus NRRL Y-2460]|uniref:FAD dependent oxidoreductase domain-containing protein n=1 Tax=Pachysolen tannophilus NRRL Y-2460 TaxID=669874 RepID=A0A1E4U0C6_PACTA|nr:hypothetical protein PACTADRAFT_139443 [Pachysolen tannophilus NRRL Y-2460]
MMTDSTKSYFPVSNPMISFWLSESDEFKHHRTTDFLPQEADVVIIGSGFSGASTAYYLYQDNPTPPKIVMLEARDVCSGATGRNGGHIKPDNYRGYLRHAKNFGTSNAAQLINFENKNFKEIAKLVSKENIACDLVLTRAVDVDMTPEEQQKTVDGYSAMMKNSSVENKEDIQIHFGETAKIISKVPDAETCITYPAGQIWPYKFVVALLQICIKKGMNLQSNTMVIKTSKLNNDKFLVKTSRGDILADKIVIATNAYTKAIAPEFDGKIFPIKGTCTHIVSACKSESLPYLTNTYSLRYSGSKSDYMIPRPDGSIVVGGAKKHIFPYREKFFDVVDDSNLIENTDRYFDNWLQKHFISMKSLNTVVDYAWPGILGYSNDSLPYVGESVSETNKFVIAGFHGHGMPRILLCGKAIANCIKKGTSIEDEEVPDCFKISSHRMNNNDNSLLESSLTHSFALKK